MKRRDFFKLLGIVASGLALPKMAEGKLIDSISPTRMWFHPASAKAWAHLGSHGKIVRSYNVAAVKEVAPGEFTVSFLRPINNAQIIVFGEAVQGEEGKR